MLQRFEEYCTPVGIKFLEDLSFIGEIKTETSDAQKF